MAPTIMPSWLFYTQGIRGYVSGGGFHGVEICSGVNGEPVTRPMTLNLEHYYARDCRDGRFVPRVKASVESVYDEEEEIFRIEIAPFEEWRIHTTITYRLARNRTIEAVYRFAFERDFSGFEAFVSTYYHQPDEPYMYLDGEWKQPDLRDDEHRFFARGDREAENINAVYNREKDEANTVRLTIDPRRVPYPIMITPIRDTGYFVVNIVEPESWSSLSANRKWNAHDFSMFARDFKAGEIQTGRSWLTYCQLSSLDEAFDLYRNLTGAKL